MERENSQPTHPELEDVKGTVFETFSAAGYNILNSTRRNSNVPLDFVFLGNGMTWGVVFVASLRDMTNNLSSSSRQISQIVEHLSSISGPEKRWNLALLVVLLDALGDDDVASVSRFEDDPSFLARFVISLEGENPLNGLRDRILFLLLDWIDHTKQGPRLQTPIDEISHVVEKEAEQLGVRAMSLQKAITQPKLDVDKLMDAILTDVKRGPLP